MSVTEPDAKPLCDLVMKGGITSGVVYPKLAAKLSTFYQFKNVGGTSAGAIAAAGCVAAEFGRLQGSQESFAKLAQLPDKLGESVGRPKASMLLHLFQPTPALEKHFAVLLGALNKPDKATLVVSAVATLLRKFNPIAWLAPLLVLAVLVPGVRATGVESWILATLVATFWLVLWFGVGWVVVARQLSRVRPDGWTSRVLTWWLGGALAIGAALTLRDGFPPALHALALAALTAINWAAMAALGLALAVGLSAAHFATTLLRGLHANHWGLCSGLTTLPQTGTQGLTEWMYAYFNDLAGLKDPARPLTFGDLWAGRKLNDDEIQPSSTNQPADAPPERVLNLEVMTTAVSQKMCFALPWRENAPEFFFDRAEWETLFPADVVAWLVKTSAMESANEAVVRKEDGTLLLRLPSSRLLPVIVAVRMSLSFPVLLSAVPLYALDYSESVGEDSRPSFAKRVWFSDGGIASNMPLHFFDAPLPGHPTFAVNLKEPHPLHPIRPDLDACDKANGRVYLPSRNASGLQRYWAPPDDTKPTGIFAFLWGIVETMQNWRDEIQFPYPGYRDRIVQVSQSKTEGGLNLNMPPENITALSQAGECAAERLVEAFLDPNGNKPEADGWHNHRLIRFRTFLGQAAAFVQHPSLRDPVWTQMLADLKAKKYTPAEIVAADALLNGMRALGGSVGTAGAGLTEKAPKPHASLRISPKI